MRSGPCQGPQVDLNLAAEPRLCSATPATRQPTTQGDGVSDGRDRAAWQPTLLAATLLLVVVGGVAAVGPAAAEPIDCPVAVSTTAPIDRVAGEDRFATAACASRASFGAGSDHVVLARGDAAGGLADALAGAVLAHAVDGPVLLTSPRALPAATAAELDRLAPERITVLGGEAAVAEAVLDEIADLLEGATFDRLAGADRAETAAAVSEAAGGHGVAFVVNGHRPADALVAAAPAARAGARLLLVQAERIPPATTSALHGVDEVVVVGGYGVVSAEVESALRADPDTEVRRVAGGDRAETAASMARAFPAEGRGHLVAGGDASLVDAVAAGWSAARDDGGPVLYVGAEGPGKGSDRWLRLGGLADERPLRLVGGPAVLGERLVTALEARYAEKRAGGPSSEVRGVWVHLFDDAVKTRRGIHRVLDDAAATNANTVIVQVARRQDAYYASEVLPPTPDPGLEDGLDILDVLLPAARDRGLSVQAWVSILPAYHAVYDGLALPSGHVWREHGPGSDDPWVTRNREGTDGLYLDPGVPAVGDHVAAVVGELAAAYDLDAVHLDYVRYEDARWGYHPASLARFRAATGEVGTPAEDDPAWNAWRRAQVDALARQAAAAVRAADPAVAVTLAASTMGAGPTSAGGYERTRTYRDVFQDWPSWLADGTIDAALPMNYFRAHVAAEQAWFDDWTTWQRDLPRGDGVLAVGQAGFLNDIDGSLTQIATARGRSDGAVVYSYQGTTSAGSGQQLLTRLAATLWSEPAPPPASITAP